VDIEFDPEKDAANIAKHGVSLALAADLDWDAALVRVDNRFAYNEVRMIALAPDTNELFQVAFVDKGDVLRVISLRHADNRERRYYRENFY
jgi:uncharacterized DUF497 family protein